MCRKIVCLLVLVITALHSSTGVNGDDEGPQVSEGFSTSVGGGEGEVEIPSSAVIELSALNTVSVESTDTSPEASESLPDGLDEDLDVELDAEASSESEEAASAFDSESEVESALLIDEEESAPSPESHDMSVESFPEPSLEPLEPSLYESIPEPSAESSEEVYDDAPQPSIESTEPSVDESIPAPSQTGYEEIDESSPSISPEDDIGGTANPSTVAEAPEPSEAITEEASTRPGGTTVQERQSGQTSLPSPDVEVTQAGEEDRRENHSSSNAGRTAGIVIGVLASVAFVALVGFGGYRAWQKRGMMYGRGWRPADMELEGLPN